MALKNQIRRFSEERQPADGSAKLNQKDDGLKKPRKPKGKRVAHKQFTLAVDQRMDAVISELKHALGKTSRADVIRSAIGLLRMADEYRAKGLRLTLSDENDVVKKEILIPWAL